MSLLKRLKEKSSNEVGFSEMYEIYKEVADFEKKLIKKYNFVDYFKSYISEIRKAIKNNKKVDTNPIFSQEELNFPGKYAYLDLNCKIVNSILFKFENYFNNFANYQKKKRDVDYDRWWFMCDYDVTYGYKYLYPSYSEKEKLAYPYLDLFNDNEKKEALKKLKEFYNSKKKFLNDNNYHVELEIIGKSKGFLGKEKREILEKKKIKIQNFKNEIDKYFDVFSKKYLKLKI